MAKELPGTLFLVVGNSGSGKDTIISGILKNYPSHLKQIYIPKRFITRPPSETEKNVSVTSDEFKSMKKNGQFALKWHIYKLDYGIPIEIDEWLKKGNPVLVNVSRTVVKKARELYTNIKVVFIYVPLEITINRLKERGRERSELLKERIDRAKNYQLFTEADFIVNNLGELKEAVDQLLNYIISVIMEN
ncbi:MAG: phosphonate metabolism protein/1,5-bisphosphokinase (PRPP-forming) PhnN [Candidatus Lokiarchaeota archaeon]|nr:phosphonate metabolism protein/1,5-bisphosphokinase (PRPP-forming) PhnN [Candidatus Lokiarchaeota archaeon]